MTTSAFAVPVRPLRPIRPFATVVVVSIALVCVASTVVSVLQLLGGEKWARPAVLTWYVLGGLLYLVAGVAFLCWLFRARANAYAISPGVFHTYPTSYLILGWIPYLCLFVPKGIVDDIWATSRPGGLWPGTDLLRVRRSGLIRAWWSAWLLSWAVAGVTVRFVEGRLNGLEAVALVAGTVLPIVAGLLAVRVVRTITDLQESALAADPPAWPRHPGQAGPFGNGAHWTHLALFTLVVRDYDEAVAFYAGTLGLDLLEDRLMDDGERWVTVRPRGARETALLLARARTPEQEALVGGQTGLVFSTADLVHDHERMTAAGIVFEGTPRREPYGTVALFSDLYGNRWELLQPNVSPVRG